MRAQPAGLVRHPAHRLRRLAEQEGGEAPSAEEKQRMLRMLKHAAAKLLRPKLVACFQRMYRLHVVGT